jgi:integrase
MSTTCVQQTLERLFVVYPEYRNAMKKRKFHQKGNTHIAQKVKSIADALDPATILDNPTPEIISKIINWTKYNIMEPSSRKLFLQQIERLHLHKDYVGAISSVCFSADERQMRSRFLQKKRSMFPNHGTQVMDKMMAMYFRLHSIHSKQRNNTPFNSGDISVEKAVDFCTDHHNGHEMKMVLLLVTGFVHSEEKLVDEVQKRLEDKSEFKRLCNLQQQDTSQWKAKSYIEAIRLVGRPREIVDKKMTAEDIIAGLQSIPFRGKGRSFSLLKTALFELKQCELVKQMELLADYHVTGVTNLVKFTKMSSWHEELLNDYTVYMRNSSKNRTSFPELLLSQQKNDFVFLMVRFEEHAKLKKCTVQEFLRCVSIEELYKILVYIGQTHFVQNDRVKSSTSTHQARNRFAVCLSVIKNFLVDRGLMGCKDQLQDLTLKRLVKLVPNLRVRVLETKERCLNGKQVQAMIDCALDPAEKLMMVLLKEYAFRNSAIGNIKYEYIVDGSQNPVNYMSLPEKGHKLRTVKSSADVKLKIQELVNFLKCHHSDDELRGCFPLNLANIRTPYKRHRVSECVKRLAHSAGITGINVYPHMMRHTLVKQLAEAGNPMELIAKMMGHSSMSTTFKNYFVPTPDEVFDMIISPFKTDFYDKRLDERSSKLVHQMVNTKVSSCMAMITVFKTAIATCTRQGGTAADVQNMVANWIPNMDEAAEIIEESIDYAQEKDKSSADVSEEDPDSDDAWH